MGFLSRSHALRGNAEAPRCGEHQAGVHHSHTRRESNLAAVRLVGPRDSRYFVGPSGYRV